MLGRGPSPRLPGNLNWGVQVSPAVERSVTSLILVRSRARAQMRSHACPIVVLVLVIGRQSNIHRRFGDAVKLHCYAGEHRHTPFQRLLEFIARLAIHSAGGYEYSLYCGALP